MPVRSLTYYGPKCRRLHPHQIGKWIVCPYCPEKRFSRKGPAEDHLKQHPELAGGDWKNCFRRCTKCDFHTIQQVNLNSHMKTCKNLASTCVAGYEDREVPTPNVSIPKATPNTANNRSASPHHAHSAFRLGASGSFSSSCGDSDGLNSYDSGHQPRPISDHLLAATVSLQAVQANAESGCDLHNQIHIPNSFAAPSFPSIPQAAISSLPSLTSYNEIPSTTGYNHSPFDPLSATGRAVQMENVYLPLTSLSQPLCPNGQSQSASSNIQISSSGEEEFLYSWQDQVSAEMYEMTMRSSQGHHNPRYHPLSAYAHVPEVLEGGFSVGDTNSSVHTSVPYLWPSVVIREAYNTGQEF